LYVVFKKGGFYVLYTCKTLVAQGEGEYNSSDKYKITQQQEQQRWQQLKK
jgi:hypothetical protein